MSTGGADYSQWTDEEMIASFKYHNYYPERWDAISTRFDIEELQGWKVFEQNERRQWSRRLALKWLRNRLISLVAIAVSLALIVSPAALVGENFGLIGGAFVVLGPLLLFGLMGTHPALHVAANKLFETENTVRQKLDLLDASISMIETRLNQLKRWRELAASEGWV